MRSKILLAIAVLAVVAGILLVSAAEAVSAEAETFEVDGLKYEINEDNETVTLTGYNEETFDPSKGLTVASTVEHEGKTYRVTAIGERAFDKCTGLDRLVLNEGLEAIGERAFWGCTGLTGTLSIPGSVTTIGEGAFGMCSGFTGAFTIPRSVTYIGDMSCIRAGFTSIVVEDGNENFLVEDGILFDIGMETLIQTTTNNVLSDYEVPSTVTRIQSAFCYCTGLTGTLAIPGSVTTIGDYAFSGCSGLERLTLNEGLETIGEYAFYGCTGLTGTLTIPSTVTSIGHVAFEECVGLERLTLNEGLKVIGDFAFWDCSGLTGALSIPSTVTAIGEGAFGYCSGFTGAFTIPRGVTEIGERPCTCAGFTSIVVEEGNENYIVDRGILFDDEKTMLIQTTTNIELSDYIVPSTVTKICKSAFYECTGLTGTLTIPNSVLSIGDYAFDGCTGLTGTLTISSNVEYIGPYAFEKTGYSDIEVDESNKYYTSKDGILFDKYMTTLIQFPSGKELADYTVPGSVTAIGPGAFNYCTKLTSVKLHDGITTIGKYAFRGCTGLTGTLTISSNVEYIGLSAFEKTGYSDIEVDESNKYYTSKDGILFDKDMKTLIQAMTKVELKDYTIPSTVTTIANSAFWECENIKGTITIGGNVKTIETAAFKGCTGITKLVIAPDVEEIVCNAFMGWSFYDVDGTTLIEDVSDLPGFTYKGTMEKMVRQEASHDSSYNIWLIVGAVVAVLVIVAIAVVLIKRKP